MKWWGLALVALMVYRCHSEPVPVSPQHAVAELCGGTQRVHALNVGSSGAAARCKDWRLMVVAIPTGVQRALNDR